MEYKNKIEDYPKSISLEGTKIILEQMKNIICKINIGNKKGIGFFCKIPYIDNNNNLLKVFITKNNIIDEKRIKIIINNEEKETELENRINI